MHTAVGKNFDLKIVQQENRQFAYKKAADEDYRPPNADTKRSLPTDKYAPLLHNIHLLTQLSDVSKREKHYHEHAAE